MEWREKSGGKMSVNMASYEGADFLLDLKQASIPNRKRFRDLAIRNDRVDVNYISFLEDIHDYCAAKFGEEEKEDDGDPSYAAFLGKLKVHGNAYMCDVSVENDVLSPIIYEEGENSTVNKIKRGTARMRIGTHGRAKGKFSQGGDQISNPRCSGFKKEMCKADKDYKVFMDNLHVVGKDTYYEYGDHKRVYYDDVEVEPPGTGIRPRTSAVVRPSTPIPKPPISPSTAQITKSKKRTLRDAQNMVNTSNKARDKTPFKEEVSLYRRELRDHLRRPYDQDEYDELYKCMSTREPVKIHRESRSGGSNREGHLGKSYLDSYPDLNSEIEKVKSNRHKVLNLLRMLQIYLQKIPVLPSDEKRPWKVDFFKTILPGSSDNN